MTGVLCMCTDTIEDHQRDGFWPQCTVAGCQCVRFRLAKRCIQCKTLKPVTEFYKHGRTAKVNPKCRDCDNARPRKHTPLRVLRTRARHRAVAELIRRHRVEFDELLELETQAAHREAAGLAEAPAAAAVYSEGQTVRLRPGQKRSGQTSRDRIDVARCPECVSYHDRGHVCANCGQAPLVGAS